MFFARLFSRLPFWFVWRLSDVLFFLAFYAVKYRRKVVLGNLTMAFPAKPEKEKMQLARQVYRGMFDVFLETLKVLTLSEKAFKKRCVITNPQEMQRIEALGKPIVLFTGHQYSWEWVHQSAAVYGAVPIKSVYIKLSNPFFEKLMLAARQRFGGLMVEKHVAVKEIMAQGQTPRYIGMASDQCPKKDNPNIHWSYFLGQPTPWFTGAEFMGNKLGAVYIYFDSKRVGRGRYEITVMQLQPHGQGPYPYTEAYIRHHETVVASRPGDYLWTHRRWKLRPSPEQLAEIAPNPQAS